MTRKLVLDVCFSADLRLNFGGCESFGRKKNGADLLISFLCEFLCADSLTTLLNMVSWDVAKLTYGPEFDIVLSWWLVGLRLSGELGCGEMWGWVAVLIVRADVPFGASGWAITLGFVG